MAVAFYDKFVDALEPSEIAQWSKIRLGREISTIYPRGRRRKDGQFYIGNIRWKDDLDIEPGLKLKLLDDYLE